MPHPAALGERKLNTTPAAPEFQLPPLPLRPPPARPQSATHLYARNLRRDPLARLVAVALRHRGRGLPLSSRSAFAEALHLFDHGESPYLTRRAFLRTVELGAGTSHPDYQHALALVHSLDAADAAALQVAA